MPVFEIDITIEDERWSDHLQDISLLTEKIITHVLSELIKDTDIIEVSIVLANDKFIQELNRDYRQKDKPTNVLSFPITDAADEIDSGGPFVSLGDIIISLDTIAAESEQQKKDIHDHYVHMLVHGCLHLLHYDHIDDEEAEEMEKLEVHFLSAFHIKNPYEVC